MKMTTTQLWERYARPGKNRYFIGTGILLLLGAVVLANTYPQFFSNFYPSKTSAIPASQQAKVTATNQASLATPLTGGACLEDTLLVNDVLDTLMFDQFDPAQGTLSQVEIVLEGTLKANIEKLSVSGSNYMLKLNSNLLYLLPTGVENALRIKTDYNRRTYTELMAQQGFQDSIQQTRDTTLLLTSDLDAFVGQGKVQIVVRAQDLVGFQNASTKLDSDFKVNVCVNYNPN